MKNLKINYLFIFSILFSIQTTLADGPVFKEPIYLKTVYEDPYYKYKYTKVITLKMEKNIPIVDTYAYNHTVQTIYDGNLGKEEVKFSRDKNYAWGGEYSLDRKDLILIQYSRVTGREWLRSKLERISL
jgi:hypothetical protein